MFLAVRATGGQRAGRASAKAGPLLPLVGPVILASSIVIGAAIALALRPGPAMVLPVIAVFGMMHGHAQGIEGPAQGLAAHAAGSALATAGPIR